MSVEGRAGNAELPKVANIKLANLEERLLVNPDVEIIRSNLFAQANNHVWEEAVKLVKARSYHVAPSQQHSPQQRVEIAQLAATFKQGQVADMLDIHPDTVRSTIHETAAALRFLQNQNGNHKTSSDNAGEIYYRDFEEIARLQNKAQEILRDSKYQENLLQNPAMRLMMEQFAKDTAITPVLDSFGIEYRNDVNSCFTNSYIEGRRSVGMIPTVRQVLYHSWKSQHDIATNLNGENVNNIIRETALDLYVNRPPSRTAKIGIPLMNLERFLNYLAIEEYKLLCPERYINRVAFSSMFPDGVQIPDEYNSCIVFVNGSANPISPRLYYEVQHIAITDGAFLRWINQIMSVPRQKMIEHIAGTLHLSKQEARDARAVGVKFADFVLAKKGSDSKMQSAFEAINDRGLLFNQYKRYFKLLRESTR